MSNFQLSAGGLGWAGTEDAPKFELITLYGGCNLWLHRCRNTFGIGYGCDPSQLVKPPPENGKHYTV